MFSRCIFFLCGLTSALPALAAPLTLDEAQTLAIANQPLLAGQQAVIEAGKQNAIAAAQLPDPRLKLGLSNVPTDNFSLSQDFMTQKTVSIEQSFPGGDKRQLRGQLAEIEAGQSMTELDSVTRSLKRDTTLAWLNLYSLLQTNTLIREQEEEFKKQIEAARIDYRTGKISQDEVLATQSMLNQLLDRDTELTAQTSRSRAELGRWIGHDAERELPDDLPASRAMPNLERLQAQLINHPEIRRLDQALAAAEMELALARESRKPDWNIEIGYAKRGPAFPDMVSAQVGIDLPLFPANRQDRTIASRQALLDKVRYQREDRLRALGAELAGSHADWLMASSRIRLLETQTIPTAKQRIQAALISYRTGKSGMTSIFEAHHTELEARLQLLAQYDALARARAQLNYFDTGEKSGEQK